MLRVKDSCENKDDLDGSLTVSFDDSDLSLKVVQKSSEPYKLSVLQGGIATTQVEYFESEEDLTKRLLSVSKYIVEETKLKKEIEEVKEKIVLLSSIITFDDTSSSDTSSRIQHDKESVTLLLDALSSRNNTQIVSAINTLKNQNKFSSTLNYIQELLIRENIKLIDLEKKLSRKK